MQDEEFLNSIGKVWMTKDMPPDVVDNEVINRIIHSITSLLTADPAKSILITGDRGTGKSTLIQLISRELKRKQWFVFTSTAAKLMAGQRYIGDLEKQVETVIQELTLTSNSLWVIPRFQELYFAGRTVQSPVSVLDQMLPSIDAGILKVVGEIDSNSLEKIIQNRPQVMSSFEIVRIAPSDKDFTLSLATDWIKKRDEQLWRNFEKNDLQEAFYLSSQYLTHQQNPGALMDFLRKSEKLFAAKQGVSRGIQLTDFIDALSNMTGMPRNILDDGERLDLDTLKSHFSTKVIGQKEAVETMVERIAMIKAGLTDPSKPAGVFLFVGPTGTGKTEIAKSMAEYLFGSEDKLIRLDMSEYQTSDALFKILGDSSDTSESMALVNTIREKPFSIILLDEFEKAHSQIWDLFLQVFDDGRLTDQRGAVADFRHSVIILTSNLGASIPTGSRIGFNASDQDINENVQKSIEATFRPEFVNRIDRVVVFNPLTKSIAKKILRNELKKILKRRGLRRRSWDIDFEDSAIEFLLEKGFSKSLGARPLKRSIEKYLLSPLALTIVNHDFPKGNQFLMVTAGKTQLKVDFIDPDEPRFTWSQKKQIIEDQTEKSKRLDIKTIIGDPRGTLSEFQVIEKHLKELKALVDELNLEQQKSSIIMADMSQPEFWSSEGRYELLHELEFLDRFEGVYESANRLFERLNDPDSQRVQFDIKLMEKLAQRVYLLRNGLESFREQQPQDAILRLSYQIHDESFAESLEQMYTNWSKKRGMKMTCFHEFSDEMEQSKYFSISGFGALRLLSPENGRHSQEFPSEKGKKNKKSKVRVDVLPMELADYKSLKKAIIQKRFENLPAPKSVRKFYADKNPIVKDSIRNWQTGKLEYVLQGNFDLL